MICALLCRFCIMSSWPSETLASNWRKTTSQALLILLFKNATTRASSVQTSQRGWAFYCPWYSATYLNASLVTFPPLFIIDWKEWEHPCRNNSRYQHHSSLWIWLLSVQPCRHPGTTSSNAILWHISPNNPTNSMVSTAQLACFLFPSFISPQSSLSGNQPTVSLLCFMGRQSFHSGRAADSNLPVVPHIRALHSLSLHPCASLLRSSCGLPCSLPSCGQRTRQVCWYIVCVFITMETPAYISAWVGDGDAMLSRFEIMMKWQ